MLNFFFFFLSAGKTTKLKTNKEDEESLSKLGGREQTGKEIRKKGKKLWKCTDNKL